MNEFGNIMMIKFKLLQVKQVLDLIDRYNLGLEAKR